jgi:hypothetical protein
LREWEDEAFVQAPLVKVVCCFEGVWVWGKEWRAGEEDPGFDGAGGLGCGRCGGRVGR